MAGSWCCRPLWVLSGEGRHCLGSWAGCWLLVQCLALRGGAGAVSVVSPQPFRSNPQPLLSFPSPFCIPVCLRSLRGAGLDFPCLIASLKKSDDLGHAGIVRGGRAETHARLVCTESAYSRGWLLPGTSAPLNLGVRAIHLHLWLFLVAITVLLPCGLGSGAKRRTRG